MRARLGGLRHGMLPGLGVAFSCSRSSHGFKRFARATYRRLADHCTGTSASLRDPDILFLDQAAPLVHVAGEHRAQIRAGAAPDLNAERLEFGLDVGRGDRLLDGGLDL